MVWTLIHSPKPPETARIEFKIRIGWGERIRTSDWLIQNQLPYHLATPQRRGHSLPRGAARPRAQAAGTGLRRPFGAVLTSGARVYTGSMDLPELLRSQ